MEERLQKILARAGLGSRRACEELIRQGRVAVEKRVAQLGQKADPERDYITVDGKPIRSTRDRCTYVAFHKPRGVLSDKGDDSGRVPIARDMVSLRGHLFPVGRLDLWSEGLILFTDDGDLAYRLTHPSFEHEKEYSVLVKGEPDESSLAHWQGGVFLNGRRTAPAEVTVARRGENGTWLRVVLREGRKRQIRRVAAMLGYPVGQLIRVRIGPVRLGDLGPGEWRHLTGVEVKALQSAVRELPESRRNGGRG